ncbi:formate/nitrite transporter family protein [Haloechinothrix sp. LS1_15]|uniref:formate/nitrite transporter family protein n=1 Tax=Haloechinothrix sp. LS1_15 TaxID=2652248 RepID=UPI002945C0D0|nr:formate/nitrite transporter family protein [Haloechinothrix sp. LS1_15]MDV6014244.1 formate/nitrite transporter family protein [Haloechinothrix sp. LS1_15]
MTHPVPSLDAYSPPEVARRVEEFGIVKARSPWWQSAMLGVLAGGFIGMGGLYYTVVTAGGQSWAQLAGGFVFATGYILAIIAGAEVFTSNNLLAMAWASRKVTTWLLLRNWGLILLANAVGAIGLAVLFVMSGLPESGGGEVGRRAIEVAQHSSTLPVSHAFALGVLGNLFVCLAVWVSLAGRSVTDRVVGIVLPLSALGAANLEHVAAGLYFLPRGLLIEWLFPDIAADVPAISVGGGALTLLVVIAGNIVGGSLMVALAYYVTYLRPAYRGQTAA